jgi:hypothetical protein
MIEVRMCQDDRVDARRIEWKRPPVALPQRLQPLKESAVHEDPLAGYLDHVLRTGDRPGRTEERQRRIGERHADKL